MAKVIDITDKLNFNENPVLKVGSIEAEVNADAETVLRLMGALAEETTMETVMNAMNLLMKPEDVQAIASLKKDGKKLSANSLLLVVREAMQLIMGDDEGEAQGSHTTI